MDVDYGVPTHVLISFYDDIHYSAYAVGIAINMRPEHGILIGCDIRSNQNTIRNTIGSNFTNNILAASLYVLFKCYRTSCTIDAYSRPQIVTIIIILCYK